MVTFTNSARRDIYISGPTATFYAGARIPFGAAVMRSGTLGRIKAVILEDTDEVIGVACGDERDHTYCCFYEIGEPVKVALKGAVVNVNVSAIDNTDLVMGDFLEIIDHTSGTAASGTGIMGEAGSAAGETRTLTSVAMALEDVTLGSVVYKAPNGTPTAGESTVTMTSGDPTLMGIQVGDLVLLRDANGTDAQVNAVTAIMDTQITVAIPIITAACDLVNAIRQIRAVLI
jgi:hypothetical protein